LVEGRAGTEPLFPQAPLDARNRRIAVTILRSEIEAKWRSRASSQDQTAQ
jgi:chemotaxis protein MotB